MRKTGVCSLAKDIVLHTTTEAAAAVQEVTMVLLSTSMGRLVRVARICALWGAVLFDFHMECFEPLFLFLWLWLLLRVALQFLWRLLFLGPLLRFVPQFPWRCLPVVLRFPGRLLAFLLFQWRELLQ